MRGRPEIMNEYNRPRNELRCLIVDLAVIFFAFVLLNRSYVFNGDAFPLQSLSDMLQLTYPTFTYTGKSLVDGVLPLWNPYMGAGYPNLAMGCSGVFYPTTWLYGWFEFPRACVWDMMLHHAFAAICAYVLGRSATRGRVAPVLLALITMRTFVFMPSVVSLGHIWTERMLSWTPLALLCTWRLLESRRLVWTIGASLVLCAQILAGDFQMLVWQELVFGLFACATVAARTIRRELPAVHAMRTFGLYVFARSFGVAAGSVQLLPAWELIGLSTRNHGVTLDYIRSISAIVDVPLVYSTLLVVRWMFPGVVAALLFLLGAISPREPRRWACVCTFALVIVISFWPDLPVADWILHVPLIGQSRDPARILEPTVFLANLLIAREFYRRFEREDGTNVSQAVWLLPMIAVCVPLVVLMTGMSIRYCAGMIALLCAGAFANTLFGKRRWVRQASGVLVALLIACEYFVQISPNVVALTQPKTQPARFDRYYPVPAVSYAVRPELERYLRRIGNTERVAAFSDLYSTGKVSLGSATGNRMFASYHALQLDNFVRWFGGISGVSLVERAPDGRLDRDNYNLWADPKWLTPVAGPVIDLLNIRYVILADGFSDIQEIVTENEGRYLTLEASQLTLAENLHAQPPAYVFHRANVVSSFEDAVKQLRRSDFEYRSVALVPPDFPLDQLTAALPGEESLNAELNRNSWRVRVRLSSQGLVVLSEANYPGWRARIDGMDTPIYTVDGILKGVVVPSGEHTVEFRFAPRLFRIGWCVSVIAIATLMGASVVLAMRGTAAVAG